MDDDTRVPSGLRSSRRLWQFAVVGGIGFLVDQGTLVLLVETLTLTVEVAKLLSAETAIVVMFLVNDRWTFQSWGGWDRRSQLIRLAKSNVVRVGGIVVALSVLSVLHREFGVNYVAANAGGILCGFLVNYVLETLYTWRIDR